MSSYFCIKYKMQYFTFLVLIYVTFVNSDNSTLSSNNTSINITSTPIDHAKEINVFHRGREGVVNSPIYTEGGVDHIEHVSNNVTVHLQSLPPAIVEEPDNLHPVQSKEVAKSSVHPRKGVNMDLIMEESINNTLPIPLTNTTQFNNTSANMTQVSKDSFKNVSNISNTNITNNINEDIVPKKPTLTISSSDAFPGVDFAADSKPLLPSNSSKIGPSILDVKVTESQTGDANINLHYKQGKSLTSQPKFVLPLVITIFAVPLLALVGYQAIRRGREAWKNRHYRRMDFLIDGMYND